MTTSPIQPENTKVTTSHKITYKGHLITVKGYHEQKFNRLSKMAFSFNWGQGGLTFGNGSFKNLRDKLDQCVATIEKNETYASKSAAFKALHSSLTTAEKIGNPNFAYLRFQSSIYGNFYNIYWRSKLSPTGVELVGGCSESEWESISKETGNSHNYYSPTENRMSAR